MPILNFQKPDKVIMLESDEKNGKFEFRPLEPGYGITIGNALRRILLSSIEGFAITSLKMDGVDHEFAVYKGIVEDFTEIILNLKQIRFKSQVEGVDSEVIKIAITDQNVFKAGDINRFLSNFIVLNPELVICHMEPNVKINMEININKGRGYLPADENKTLNLPFGTIMIDAIYTPIKVVNYKIEDYRVEQKTDFEKLTLEIVTDGSITPKDALKDAASILIQHFALFTDEEISLENDSRSIADEYDETAATMKQLLSTKLNDLDLSVRAINCLKSAEVETIGELVSFNKNDLLKFRNFGKKTLVELEELLKNKNLEFGMNVNKYYKPDKKIR